MSRPIGIYEKALPKHYTWIEKLKFAKELGFDFVELSIDESDTRLARLDWSKEQRLELGIYIRLLSVVIGVSQWGQMILILKKNLWN